ncbi:hypothetical protein COOONC_16401 [Cooperia oncophora]
MVFKVKCSNNSLFKVSPVYAFLDSGASMDLQAAVEILTSMHQYNRWVGTDGNRIDVDILTLTSLDRVKYDKQKTSLSPKNSTFAAFGVS